MDDAKRKKQIQNRDRALAELYETYKTLRTTMREDDRFVYDGLPDELRHMLLEFDKNVRDTADKVTRYIEEHHFN